MSVEGGKSFLTQFLSTLVGGSECIPELWYPLRQTDTDRARLTIGIELLNLTGLQSSFPHLSSKLSLKMKKMLLILALKIVK